MSIFRRENVQRLLLVAGSVIFALLVLEFLGLARVVNYRRLILGPRDWFANTNRYDPELMHIHPPHSHFSGAVRGGNDAANFRIPSSDLTAYHWDDKYDENGFRNDVDLKTADVVVIGDSFVEGNTIPTAQLTTSLLANLQHKVVANLGQYGYGPREELAVLKRYALPLQPRVVVWMFFEGNDLRDLIHYDQMKAGENKPESLRSALWEPSFTHVALAWLKLEYKDAFRPLGVTHSAVVEASDGKKTTVYFIYPAPSVSRDNLDAMDQTVLTLTTAYQLCAARGARLLFVYIPTKFRALRPFCRFPQESECRQWSLSDLPERLQRALESISPEIGFLDLTPDLADGVKRGELPYYVDDDHWSPEGHKIAAEAINDYLSSMRGGHADLEAR